MPTRNHARDINETAQTLFARPVYQRLAAYIATLDATTEDGQTRRQVAGNLIVEHLQPGGGVLTGENREVYFPLLALVLGERPVAATIIGSRYEVGDFAIIGDDIGDRDDDARTLVCVACEYVRWPAEDEREDGWYADFAEPTDSERQSAAYQEAEAQRVRRAALQAAEEATWKANREAARGEARAWREAHGESEMERQTREKARAGGMDVDLWDLLFDGTSDN